MKIVNFVQLLSSLHGSAKFLVKVSQNTKIYRCSEKTRHSGKGKFLNKINDVFLNMHFYVCMRVCVCVNLFPGGTTFNAFSM